MNCCNSRKSKLPNQYEKRPFYKTSLTPCKGKVFALRECCNKCCRRQTHSRCVQCCMGCCMGCCAKCCHRRSPPHCVRRCNKCCPSEAHPRTQCCARCCVAVAPAIRQFVASTVALIMDNFVISPDALNRFRNAASQVARGVASPVSRWLPLKDDISALRKRGLSYRAISDLLSQNGINASPSGLMRFCRRILKEKRSHKSPARRQPPRRADASASPKNVPVAPARTTPPPAPATTSKPTTLPAETSAFASRGPRIAKVEMLPPGEEI